MPLRFTLRLALTLLAAACGRGEAPAPPADSQAPAADAADPVLGRAGECVNREEGYAVAYPEGWRPVGEELMGPCRLFHPGPILIPEGGELPLEVGVALGFEAVPFATVSGEMMGRTILAREPASVDGREGVRILAETTGEGLHERGIRYYEYLVDLGDTTMVATTYDAGTPDFETRRRILDAMMARFDFRQPG